MEPIDSVLTQLALDPFECLRFDESQTIEASGHTWSRDELFRALEPDASRTEAVAGEGWARCETCSDPGPDDDPFPYGIVRDPGRGAGQPGDQGVFAQAIGQ